MPHTSENARPEQRAARRQIGLGETRESRSARAAPASRRRERTYGDRAYCIDDAHQRAGRPRRARRTSSAQLVEASLAAIARAPGGARNAFITVDADGARRDAAALDRERARGRLRGPLHGMPISLKDLIDVAGSATTAASRVLADRVATADADVVTRLRGRPARCFSARPTCTSSRSARPARTPRSVRSNIRRT